MVNQKLTLPFLTLGWSLLPVHFSSVSQAEVFQQRLATQAQSPFHQDPKTKVSLKLLGTHYPQSLTNPNPSASTLAPTTSATSTSTPSTSVSGAAPPPPTAYYFLLGNLKLEGGPRQNKATIEVMGSRNLVTQRSQIGVQETYFQVNTGVAETGGQLFLGRKKQDWNDLDRRWLLGVWEPKWNFDALAPLRQGLTGAFYQQSFLSDQWQVLAYWSPLFVPTMGPEIREENGTLVSDSRWYRAPSTEHQVMDRPLRVTYKLDIGDLSHLVSHSGSGLRLSFNNPKETTTTGLWASVSYASKPMNALLIRYDEKMLLKEGQTSEGMVVAGPLVGLHQLWGGDLGYRGESGEIVLSYLMDAPIYESPTERETRGKLSSPISFHSMRTSHLAAAPPSTSSSLSTSPSSTSDWVEQRATPMSAQSLHFGFRVPLWFHSLVWDQPEIYMDYLHISGGQLLEGRVNESLRSSLFPYRFDFYNSISTGLILPAYFWGQRILAKMKWLRDFDQLGTIFQMSFRLDLKNHVSFDLGVDFLGVDQDRPDNRDPSFINQFRANDRIYGAIGYGF